MFRPSRNLSRGFHSISIFYYAVLYQNLLNTEEDFMIHLDLCFLWIKLISENLISKQTFTFLSFSNILKESKSVVAKPCVALTKSLNMVSAAPRRFFLFRSQIKMITSMQFFQRKLLLNPQYQVFYWEFWHETSTVETRNSGQQNTGKPWISGDHWIRGHFF